jgi:hypothetical protein
VAARFARAGRDAIAQGVPITNPGGVAGVLRHAGTALGMGEESALAALADELQALVPTARATAPPPAEPAPLRPVAAAASPPPPATAAPTPAAVASPIHHRPAPAPAPPVTVPGLDEPDDLAGSLMRYRRYLETLGLGTPSLSELLAGPPADPRAPAPTVGAAPAPTPVVAAPVTITTPEPVPITALCYRGAAALQRAAGLRAEVAALFAAGVPAAEVRELVEEVFDLVQLGLEAAH